MERYQMASQGIKMHQKRSKDIEINQNKSLLYIVLKSLPVLGCAIRRTQRNQQFFTPSLQSRDFALSFLWDTTNSQSFLDRRYGKAFKMSSFLSFTTLA